MIWLFFSQQLHLALLHNEPLVHMLMEDTAVITLISDEQGKNPSIQTMKSMTKKVEGIHKTGSVKQQGVE